MINRKKLIFQLSVRKRRTYLLNHVQFGTDHIVAERLDSASSTPTLCHGVTQRDQGGTNFWDLLGPSSPPAVDASESGNNRTVGACDRSPHSDAECPPIHALVPRFPGVGDVVSYSSGMRDVDIRAALVDNLRDLYSGDKIVNEMGLCLGATRVDVAVINGSLHGYEIKSDRDTLTRLPTQVALYNRVLDFSTVVCGPRYVTKIRDVVPEWWGITEVRAADGIVTLRSRRKPRRNRSCDPLSVAQLLWRDEAAEALAARGEVVKRRETRWQLWDRLAEWALPDLQLCVRDRLKARPRWINN